MVLCVNRRCVVENSNMESTKDDFTKETTLKKATVSIRLRRDNRDKKIPKFTPFCLFKTHYGALLS